MPGTQLLLLLVPVLAAGAATVAVVRRRRGSRPDGDDWSEVDVVIDLEFLRARPSDIDQRITELVMLSGDKTLGARMRTRQQAHEPAAAPGDPAAVRTRRRTAPLKARP